MASTISVGTFMPAGKSAFQNVPAYSISHPRMSNSGLINAVFMSFDSKGHFAGSGGLVRLVRNVALIVAPFLWLLFFG